MAATGKRGATAISTSARTGAAATTDYPINDDNSLMKVANFNGVGGGTILYTAHYPADAPVGFPRAFAGRRGR